MRKNIPANQPLTKAQAMSLRQRGKGLTPAQRAVLAVEELTTPEEIQLEEAMVDLSYSLARRLEGLTPKQVFQLLMGELDADEVRDLLNEW